MTSSASKAGVSQHKSIPMHTHIVQFSENDVSLVTTVSSFLWDGLRAGDACLVVVTPSHRDQLEQRLKAEGFDLAAAQADGLYVVIDAREALARFMLDEQPDPARFSEFMKPLIERATLDQRSVRIFGEGVALLWTQGHCSAALRLEELWNELGHQYAFSLLCAYPMRDISRHSHEDIFVQICQQHSQIVPSESYTSLSEQERLRTFLVLQQKAYALETEVAQRQAAQERLQILAAIVESTDDAVLSKDLDGIITSWNTSAERIYGYLAQEIIGQPVTRIFPPGRQDEFEQIMARIRRGERIEHHETRRMRKDGTFLTVSVTISPLKNEEGRIIGASTIARDVTEQRLLEAKSHQLFASNLVGIFVANAEGALLEANQALLDLLGESPVKGQPEAIASLAPFLYPLVLQASQAEDMVELQETEIHRNSGQIIPVMVAVTRLANIGTYIGFVLDISERKALEQRKDAFIGMASHELKTPITSLKGFLGVLRRLFTVQDTEKILHCLTRMDAQIDKLTKLINDLLDISRIQAGQIVYREERVEVDGLVQEIVESTQETTRTHRLQREGQSGATVFGDRDRLGQVLINLLNNAIKYSPQADKVIIHLSSTETQVCVSVQDFGLGIALAHHQKIFEQFYQVTDSTEKTYPGLGIGLAISHNIVTRHGGRIWVESEQGAGATFHLCLPRAPQEKNL